MPERAPIGFGAIRGHGAVIAGLRAAARQSRLAHALIFAGADGIGKSGVARGLAAWLVCEAKQDDACGECAACRLVAAGTQPDLQIVSLAAGKKEIGVDKARELKRFAQLRPLRAESKVVVVDDAQALNVAAQNALLKTLEEPPAHSFFILVANNADAMLPTVRSRCQRVTFAPLENAAVADVLTALHGVDSALAMELAALSEGSPGRALLLRGHIDAGAGAQLLSLLADLGGARYYRVMQIAQALSQPEGELPIKLELLLGALRDEARGYLQTGDSGLAEASGRRTTAVLKAWGTLQRTHPNRTLLVDSLLLQLGRL